MPSERKRLRVDLDSSCYEVAVEASREHLYIRDEEPEEIGARPPMELTATTNWRGVTSQAKASTRLLVARGLPWGST